MGSKNFLTILILSMFLISCKRTNVKYYLTENFEGSVVIFYSTPNSHENDWNGRVIEYRIPKNGILMLGKRPFDNASVDFYFLKKDKSKQKIRQIFKGDTIKLKNNEAYRYIRQSGGVPVFNDKNGEARLSFSYDYFVITKDSTKIIPYLEQAQKKIDSIVKIKYHENDFHTEW